MASLQDLPNDSSAIERFLGALGPALAGVWCDFSSRVEQICCMALGTCSMVTRTSELR